MWNFPVAPEQASTFAGEMDAIYYLLWALTMFFSVAVLVTIVFFAVRFRRGAKATRTGRAHHNVRMEIVWTIIPLVLGLGVFSWSASLYVRTRSVPPAAQDIYVVAKRWMWQIQHPSGIRENNELHVPVDTPIKLTMISQDVIHSFFVPAFRIKQDVLPGRYTQEWFRATKPGKYRLFCAEYCGTQHSEMGGWITVLSREDYQRWLTAGGNAIKLATRSMEEGGKALYDQLACANCHNGTSAERGGGVLTGVAGATVALQDGKSVRATDEYLRESLVKPNEKIVKGYWPTMPAYDQLTEEQILQLIAYIKTLRAPEAPVSAVTPAPTPRPAAQAAPAGPAPTATPQAAPGGGKR